MWQLTGSGDGPYEIQEDGKRIALITHTDLKTARKMAAASQLLEALESVLQFDVSPTFDAKGTYTSRKASEWYMHKRQVRAAIAIAGGN
jgi:hypothetical protein